MTERLDLGIGRQGESVEDAELGSLLQARGSVKGFFKWREIIVGSEEGSFFGWPGLLVARALPRQRGRRKRSVGWGNGHPDIRSFLIKSR